MTVTLKELFFLIPFPEFIHLAEDNDEIQGLRFGFCCLKELGDGFDHRLHGWIVFNVEHGQLSQLIGLHSGHLVVFTSERCLPLHVRDVVGDGGGHHLQAVKLHVHVENLAKLDEQGLPLAEDLKEGRAGPGRILNFTQAPPVLLRLPHLAQDLRNHLMRQFVKPEAV